jgi:hypothetical protein
MVWEATGMQAGGAERGTSELTMGFVTEYYEWIFRDSILRKFAVTVAWENWRNEEFPDPETWVFGQLLVRAARRVLSVLAVFFLILFLKDRNDFARADARAVEERAPIKEALGWVKSATRPVKEFDYAMSVRVRLLFFWAGKDDVGGGYIRRGYSKEDPRQELLQVLFGSDPAKAPRAINRWGAGTEVVWHKNVPAVAAVGVGEKKNDDVVSSAFFGFMKGSKGKNVAEMQEELKREKNGGEHQFTGILSRVDSGQAVSLVVPLASNVDFNLNQYVEAEPVMLERLSSSDRPLKVLQNNSGCDRAVEFLGAVAQLADGAMENPQVPKSVCYVYDAQVNTLTLEHAEPVKQFDVKVNASKGGTLLERSYADLLQADFVSTHATTGKKVYFTILLGTQGDLRGTPVQIRYQPNWWFQVVLNLMPQESGTAAAVR